MELSIQMTNSLLSFFDESYYNDLQYVGGNNTMVRADSYNFLSCFVRVQNPKGPIIEVPTITNVYVGDFVNGTMNEVVIPLTVLTEQNRRTADTILKWFFGNGRRYREYLGLKKAVTSKGDVYYGTKGIILDKDFTPLIVGIKEYDRDGLFGATSFNRAILKVHPKVFTSDGIIEKAIIKKLIPFYSTRAVSNRTVKVEVDDTIVKYVLRPSIPRGKAINEDIRTIISENKEEILKDML